jgi:catechol 2,3-dioxygenase-like lactoylglutathione lyase family enzyme
MIRNQVLVTALVTTALAAPGLASAADYHHVHITSASPLQAVDWYTRHMGCEPVTDRNDAANCYGVEVVFVPQITTGTSQGTGIDHIGFSVSDLPAKMTELENVGVRGSGVRLQRNDDGSTWRDVPGLFKIAFVFDPWGTRIEMVEDPETLGFHHVHLSAADPDATLAWYRDVMGGTPDSLKGRLDGLRFGDVWFLVSQNAEGLPGSTIERAIDHIAFTLDDLDSAAADFRRQDVRFEQEPSIPEGGRTSAKRAFLVGPDNVRVAVVETGFAGIESDIGSAILTADSLGNYDTPDTPWGEPDLQGIWTSSSAVGIPFERPENVDASEVTADEAIARHEGRLLGGIWGYEREWRDTTLEYGSAVSTQSAMIIDPPDGRLPSRITEENTQALAGDERTESPTTATARSPSPSPYGVPAGPEDLSTWVRCITRGLIPTPGGYNNGLQIVQGPGFVAITREMVHETRIVPTTPQPALGEKVTAYLGSSRGHWDGDTLIVETTNFNGGASFRGSSENLALTESYTRVGPATLEYKFTLDDPTVWTQPWTAMFRWDLDESQYELVEYSCHEGNYGMTNILSGARATDAGTTGR